MKSQKPNGIKNQKPNGIMGPLNTTKQVLTWLCAHPSDNSTSKSIKMGYIVFSVIFFICLVIGILGSGAYFVKYILIHDLENALYALFQTVSLTAAALTHIVLVLSQWDLAKIFVELSKIYEASEY